MLSFSSPTDGRVPMGLPNHLSDVYMEELEKAISASSEDSSTLVPLSTLLDPFLSLMAQTSNNSVYKRIEASLLKPLLDDLNTVSRSESEPMLKRARIEPKLYPNLIARTFTVIPQAPGSVDQSVRRSILRNMFEIASRQETKDVRRRKMYRLWKEEGDGDED
jgi:ribosomal RNA-processing protein 1